MNNFQKASLEKFLAGALAANGVEVLKSSLLSGGAVQENWALDLQVKGGAFDGVLNTVLRSDSPTAGVAISHGRAQEFALLHTVFNAGVTVPQPICLCTDTAVFVDRFFNAQNRWYSRWTCAGQEQNIGPGSCGARTQAWARIGSNSFH